MPVTSWANAFLGTLSQGLNSWLAATEAYIVSDVTSYAPLAIVDPAGVEYHELSSPIKRGVSFGFIVLTIYTLGLPSSLYSKSISTTSWGISEVMKSLSIIDVALFVIPKL